MGSRGAEGSPDEKIFTTRDENGFFPNTRHPTPNTLLQFTRIYRQAELERIIASLKAASQILITSGEGMGKSFLAHSVYEQLSSQGFTVALIEPASPKQMLTNLANSLGVETRNLEGRAISADGLKAAIAIHLSIAPAFLIFDDAHLLEAKFRIWLKGLRKINTPLLLTATRPNRTDIFLNLPRIELQPLPDYAIRELMEIATLDRGINLKPSEFAKLQERAGGNPLLAIRAIDEEFIGLDNNEAGDHERYFDITPLILLVGIIFVATRFIALGTNNQSLYILAGIGGAIFLGLARLLYGLPKETRRIN